MAHSVEEIASYDFKSSDKLLLDTNVWMFVYGPQDPKDKRVAVYSQALSKIFSARSRIYIDVLIVSEFINTYAKLKWRLLSPSSKFKQFRKSKYFKPVAQEIASDIKRVLKDCTRIESGFESLMIDTLLDGYALGDSDFNDDVLVTLCKKKGLKLLTDDGDFKKRDVAVITANKNLLT